MTTQDSLSSSFNRLCDYLALMVDNGIEIDGSKLQDVPGVKMDPHDPEASARAADRARTILLKHGITA